MSDYQPSAQATAFIQRLERLDPGGRARLKRNAGAPLGESRDALGLFYSVLPAGVPASEEEWFFLAATLYPLADGGGRGDLGAALQRARQASNAKGLDRRVEILLNADATQIPFRLRQAIRFLQSNRVRVNWPQLVDDLRYWTHPERRVQRRWARSYFAG